MQLDEPWAVRVSQDVTFGTDVCELVFLVLEASQCVETPWK
jgi:hypothetical protein